MRCKYGTGSDPVTGSLPVPQVLLVKGQHYIFEDINITRADFTEERRGQNYDNYVKLPVELTQPE
jgi:hypothetical protein